MLSTFQIIQKANQLDWKNKNYFQFVFILKMGGGRGLIYTNQWRMLSIVKGKIPL